MVFLAYIGTYFRFISPYRKSETPACTLRHFPYSPDHTIQWAQEKFDHCFTISSQLANEFCLNFPKFSERIDGINEEEKVKI